jgi:hypothetical protein
MRTGMLVHRLREIHTQLVEDFVLLEGLKNKPARRDTCMVTFQWVQIENVFLKLPGIIDERDFNATKGVHKAPCRDCI